MKCALIPGDSELLFPLYDDEHLAGMRNVWIRNGVPGSKNILSIHPSVEKGKKLLDNYEEALTHVVPITTTSSTQQLTTRQGAEATMSTTILNFPTSSHSHHPDASDATFMLHNK